MRNRDANYFQLGWMVTGVSIALEAHLNDHRKPTDHFRCLKALEEFFDMILNTGLLLEGKPLPDSSKLENIDLNVFGFVLEVMQRDPFAVKTLNDFQEKIAEWKKAVYNIHSTMPGKRYNQKLEEVLRFLDCLTESCLAKLSPSPL